MAYKTGKLDPKFNPKTLLLDEFLTGELPDPASKVYREYKVPPFAKRMFKNDRIGDCTVAGIANHKILLTCHTGSPVVATDDQVIEFYSAVSGYDPKTGANDNGAAMTDVLERYRTVGFLGEKILGWTKIDHTNVTHRRIVIDLFGALYAGVQLPRSAQQQFHDRVECHWSVVPNSPNDGGHCMIEPGYGALGEDYVTWANWEVKVPLAWNNKYLDEGYAIITEDLFEKDATRSFTGVDMNALWNAIKLL